MRFLRKNTKNFIQQYTNRMLMSQINNLNRVKYNTLKPFSIKKFMLRIFSMLHKVSKTTKTLKKTVFQNQYKNALILQMILNILKVYLEIKLKNFSRNLSNG